MGTGIAGSVSSTCTFDDRSGPVLIVGGVEMGSIARRQPCTFLTHCTAKLNSLARTPTISASGVPIASSGA